MQHHYKQRQLCTYAVFLSADAVNSLGVVLGQEMQRFNRLLSHVTASLQQLTKALKVQSPTHKTLGPTYLSSDICLFGSEPCIHLKEPEQFNRPSYRFLQELLPDKCHLNLQANFATAYVLSCMDGRVGVQFS